LDVEANSPSFAVGRSAAECSAAQCSAAGRASSVEPAEAVTLLYQVHAVGMIRLAVVMLGDRAAAEDVVQDAFCALYRRFGSLDQPDRALAYVRSSVLNGCRSELRARRRGARRAASTLSRDAASAEDDALLGEEHRQVLRALRRLPDRQRESLILRFYLDLPEAEVARSMGISQGTVKSTTSRALAALASLLGEHG
jgi:RNA polymerase sigma-70 factor (sigma-E family)